MSEPKKRDDNMITEGLDRRDLLKTLGLGALAVTAGAITAAPALAGERGKKGSLRPYVLPKLPYAYDALEPALDEKVLRIHHTKHHAGYVRGLNATLSALEKARGAENFSQIKALSRALAFHGSGHVLHTLYWQSMRPKGAAVPKGRLGAAILRDFGSFVGFERQFKAAAKKVEGSGWAVLAFEPMGRRLLILQAEKHQNLAIWGAVPLMVCDVWEHAYYDQYQNRRGAYVEGFFKLIDWPTVAHQYAAALVR